MDSAARPPAIVRKPIDLNCPKCQQWTDGAEVYSVTRFTDNALLVWDIELARHICSDGRAAVAVSADWLSEALRINQTEIQHLDHVDPAVPGIACTFGYSGDVPIVGLIDGSHGAARCCRDGLPFRVYVLTDSESLLCQNMAKRRFIEFVSQMDSPGSGSSC
jgi:hypothetical protein